MQAENLGVLYKKPPVNGNNLSVERIRRNKMSASGNLLLIVARLVVTCAVIRASNREFESYPNQIGSDRQSERRKKLINLCTMLCNKAR